MQLIYYWASTIQCWNEFRSVVPCGLVSQYIKQHGCLLSINFEGVFIPYQRKRDGVSSKKKNALSENTYIVFVH